MDFEQKLMNKYPELFHKKEDGSLECPCGVWVPEGWQTIVDELCGSINNYVKNTHRLESKIISKKYYFWRSICKLLNWGHKRFIKIFPKLNKREYNLPFYSFVEKFRQRSYKCVEFYYVYPPAVKIDQIKSKFSDLRFYYSGGDKKIDGMVTFASYLANKTCEVSGEKGELCSSNGGWYKTLSPKICEESPYNSYKPIKQ